MGSTAPDGIGEQVPSEVKCDCLEVATCNAMLEKALRLHSKTEGLLSSVSNVCQSYGMGNWYHANHFFVISGLDAVTEYAVSLDVTFIVRELILQILLAAQVGLPSLLIFMYSS